MSSNCEPQQEPVACIQDLDEVKRKHLVYEKGMDWKDPLYTTPPAQRQARSADTWVGLNLDERLELAQDVDWAAGAYCEYAEKVEAKLREKNT